MPEHLKALAVILVLAAGVFAFAKGPVLAAGTSARDFALRRNTWFAVTLTAFLAHGFWVFIAAAAAVLVLAAAKERNRLALFFGVLFAVPAMSVDIPGFAGVRVLFAIDSIRLLALAVLLPAFAVLAMKREGEAFGRRWPDRLLLLYLGLNFALMLASSSPTHALRQGVFCAFIDVFLPYYVASRALRSVDAFRDAMAAFVVSALVLAVTGIFESGKQWLLYRALEDALRVPWNYGNYLERGGHLRALGSAGQPIAFGFVMAVAMGFLLYLRRCFPRSLHFAAGFTLLGVALVASVSRGPWLGAAVIVLLGLAPGRSLAARFAATAMLGLVVAPVLFLTPVGPALVDLLPFVGTVDAQTIMYRQQLLDAFMEVIEQKPLFGAYDYMLSPAVEDLRQGEGIIDIVNTYVGVGFSSGLVGLSLFVAFFCAVMGATYTAARSFAGRDAEAYALGQILVATLLGILVMIAAVASITVIPAVYWALAGVCVGYARMAAARAPLPSTVHDPRAARGAAVPPVPAPH